MRAMKPLARSIPLVAFPLLALAACSSEVVTSGSGGSGAGGDAAGGAGGAVGSTVSTSATTASTTGTTSGGGTPCEQGCAKIEMCTGFTCAQANIDCGDPQFDCLGTCVVDATCADIIALAQGNGPPELQACAQACQGGGQGKGAGCRAVTAANASSRRTAPTAA